MSEAPYDFDRPMPPVRVNLSMSGERCRWAGWPTDCPGLLLTPRVGIDGRPSGTWLLTHARTGRYLPTWVAPQPAPLLDLARRLAECGDWTRTSPSKATRAAAAAIIRRTR